MRIISSFIFAFNLSFHQSQISVTTKIITLCLKALEIVMKDSTVKFIRKNKGKNFHNVHNILSLN